MQMQTHVENSSVHIPRSELLEGVVMLAARLLIAPLFIIAGVRKMLAWDATVKYMSMHLPAADVLIYAVVILEVGGGIMLAAGWRTRQLAILLAVFTLAAGLLFHQFWAAPVAQYAGQLNNFLKNVAIAGGLLMLVLHGGGSLSVDQH